MRLAFLLLLSFLLATAPVRADDDADRARAALRAGRVLPLAQIVQTLRGQITGEVLEAELDDDDDDGPQYEIRMLTPQGRIVELEVDARSGRILDMDGDDD